MQDFLDAFSFIGNNIGGVLKDKILEQLSISVEAMAIALVLAIPLGIWLGHLHRGSFVAINGSNIFRALPSLGVIAIMLGIFGIGRDVIIIALVVLAVPPMLTNAYVAIDSVDRDAVEAATGMGMRPLEVLLRVELPLALPLLFAGIRTSALFVIATAPLAGFVGGGTLGEIIANQASYRLSGVIGAAFCVAILAIFVEVGFAALQKAVTPRGLRSAVRPGAALPTLDPLADASSPAV
jgi:osmoprotectant transport system permease protein